MIPRLLVQRAVLIALLVAPGLCRAAPPSMTRDEIICRAKSGLGYSYWWGGSCWCSSGCSPHFSACGSGTCNCWCGS